MNIKHMAMVAIIVVLIAALLWPADGFEEGETLDCGNNQTCIQDAMHSCSPAEYLINENGSVNEIKVLGQKDGRCEISIANLGTPFPTELTNKSMICLLPFGNSLNDTVNYTESCTGTMADTYSMIGKEIVQEKKDFLSYGTYCEPLIFIDDSELSYRIIGRETKDNNEVCHSEIKTNLPGIGMVVLDYYFNKTSDGLSARLEDAVALPVIEANCNSPAEDFFTMNFSAVRNESEGKVLDGRFVCHHYFEILPLGPPILSLDTYSVEGTGVSILLRTERLNVYDMDIPFEGA